MNHILAQIASAKPEFLWQFIIVISGFASLSAAVVSMISLLRKNRREISNDPLRVQGVPPVQTLDGCKKEHGRIADQISAVLDEFGKVSKRVDENATYAQQRRQGIYEKMAEIQQVAAESDTTLRKEFSETVGNIYTDINKLREDTSALKAMNVSEQQRLTVIETDIKTLLRRVA